MGLANPPDCQKLTLLSWVPPTRPEKWAVLGKSRAGWLASLHVLSKRTAYSANGSLCPWTGLSATNARTMAQQRKEKVDDIQGLELISVLRTAELTASGARAHPTHFLSSQPAGGKKMG
jgi:hypothetical protein